MAYFSKIYLNIFHSSPSSSNGSNLQKGSSDKNLCSFLVSPTWVTYPDYDDCNLSKSLNFQSQFAASLTDQNIFRSTIFSGSYQLFFPFRIFLRSA